MSGAEQFLIFTGDVNAGLQRLSHEEHPNLHLSAVQFPDLKVLSFDPLRTVQTDRSIGAVLLREGKYRLDALQADISAENPDVAAIYGIVALDAISEVPDSHAGLILSLSDVNTIAKHVLGPDVPFIAGQE